MYKGRQDRGSRFGGGGQRSFFAPVKVGEEIEVKIEAVGEKGDGIAKIKGFVIFVPNAKEGETVKVRINKVLRKVGFAEIVGKGSSKSEESDSEDMAVESESEETSEDSSVTEEPESEETSEDSESFGDEQEEF